MAISEGRNAVVRGRKLLAWIDVSETQLPQRRRGAHGGSRARAPAQRCSGAWLELSASHSSGWAGRNRTGWALAG